MDKMTRVTNPMYSRKLILHRPLPALATLNWRVPSWFIRHFTGFISDAVGAKSSAETDPSSVAKLAPRDSPEWFRLSSEVHGIPLVATLTLVETLVLEEDAVSDENWFADDAGLGSGSHMLEL